MNSRICTCKIDSGLSGWQQILILSSNLKKSNDLIRLKVNFTLYLHSIFLYLKLLWFSLWITNIPNYFHLINFAYNFKLGNSITRFKRNQVRGEVLRIVLNYLQSKRLDKWIIFSRIWSKTSKAMQAATFYDWRKLKFTIVLEIFYSLMILWNNKRNNDDVFSRDVCFLLVLEGCCCVLMFKGVFVHVLLCLLLIGLLRCCLYFICEIQQCASC